MDFYVDKGCRVGIAEQGTYGTAAADSVAVTQLLCEAPTIVRGYQKRDIDTYQGARTRVDGSLMFDTKGAAPEVTIKGQVRLAEVDFFLYALIQQVSEAATTPYGKTFTWPTTQPDFATASAGETLTLFLRNELAARSWKLKDCICKSLKFNFEEGGRLTYETVLVGRGAPASSTPSGTWTDVGNASVKHFHDIGRFSANFGAGAQALTIKSAEIAITQDILTPGHTSASFDSYALLNRKVMVKARVFQDTNFASWFTNCEASTATTLRLGWGNATAGTVDGDLDFSVRGILSEPKEVWDDGILAVDVELEESTVSTLATAATTIILANALDRTW